MPRLGPGDRVGEPSDQGGRGRGIDVGADRPLPPGSVEHLLHDLGEPGPQGGGGRRVQPLQLLADGVMGGLEGDQFGQEGTQGLLGAGPPEQVAAPRHHRSEQVGDGGVETGWRVPDLLAAALADPAFYFDALSQVRMDSWSRGRVALVGDAAWCASPASGAGAELALVGAYWLAGELAAARGDHRVAFPAYHRGHRALVGEKHRIGMNVRLMVPGTRVGKWARDAFARLPLTGAMGAVERLTRAEPPALPHYVPAR